MEIILDPFADTYYAFKVSRRTDEDDFWNGYFIPKGTTVFCNVWAMHMDPNAYSNPTTFDPDRFLGKYSLGGDSKDNDQLSKTNAVPRWSSDLD